MKFKKIFVISVLLLVVFLIYLTTMDKKIYFLVLGDSFLLEETENYSQEIIQYLNEKNLLEKGQTEFVHDDLRITDLIRNIEDNQKVIIKGKEQAIKNALIKADLLVLSIGNEELFYKMRVENSDNLYSYIDQMMEDMEHLLQIIREYCKEDIFIFGYVNPFSATMNSYITYANQKLETLSKKYDISYISLDLLKKEDYQESNIKASGTKKITQLLIPHIEKFVLQD